MPISAPLKYKAAMMKTSFAIVLGLFLFTQAPSAHALSWKGVFIAGDDSIENFDNGREDLTAAFARQGTIASTVQLSTSTKYIGSRGVLAATAENIVGAFTNLNAKSGEGCLVHLTSHGAKGQGFYLKLAGILPPDALAQLVNKACGDQPTVVLVSACYSGQFIIDALKGPNRVILTAARADRPSFGCSADTEYTYWDHCLLNEIPNSRSWSELYGKVQACITEKEAALGAQPSGPQAFFGKNTADWSLLH